MSGFVSLAVMSALLGASSFGVGMLPLYFVFSRSAMSRLTHFGSGLLLGAGLGIIIPEGIETLVYSQLRAGYVPTPKIALSLLTGFTFMLIVEQVISPYSHDHSKQSPSSPLLATTHGELEFDIELAEAELELGMASHHHPRNNIAQQAKQTEPAADRAIKNRAYPLTLGLVLHALADGLALGSSVLSDSESTQLSLIVFLALIIHKAPTALALTTSLLATSLPRADCKKHIAIFSAATPIGALVFYAMLYFFGATRNSDWTGLAILVSGGSFLYVATVLQPVSPHSGHQTAEEDVGQKSRTLFTALGMFAPICISSIIGHGHS